MSDKELNNTIFLMYLVICNYCNKYNLTIEEFLELDKKYEIINYVAECPWVFDPMTDEEMVAEIEAYIGVNIEKGDEKRH